MAMTQSTALATAIANAFAVNPGAALFSGFVIDFYSGTKPTTPDTGATAGNLIVTLSPGGAVANGGTTGTGCTWSTSNTDNVLEKAAAETWQGTTVATLSAGGVTGVWARFRLVADAGTATNTTAKRFDVNLGTSGSDINLSSTTFYPSSPITLSTFTYTQPTP